jgi:hypothetical protein
VSLLRQGKAQCLTVYLDESDAIFYLLANMLGGVLAVFLGGGLGLQCIKFVRHVPKRKHVQAPLSTTFYKMTKEEHMDLQDDILSK